MRDSSAEERRRWEREQRRAEAMRNIRALEGRVARYEQAKAGVEQAKQRCGSQSGEWESTKGQMAGKETQKPGTFEGEMAENLEEYLTSTVEENNRGIQSSRGLEGSLAGQVSTIDGKIAELQNDISYWWSRW